jgi:Icc-related predicted phosphoesterase
MEMRILAAADIHGFMSVYNWLAELAREPIADVLVLAGDLLSCDSEDEQRKQARSIIAVLKTMRIPVFYIMGNDDFIALDYQDEQIRPLHGQRLQFGNYNFVGYQFSLPFVGGIFEKPEEDIADDVHRLEPFLDDRTILVSHSPAFGVLDQTFSGVHAGSRSLRELINIKCPLVHIHGHVHNGFGQDGKHFNVAAAGTRRAICVELPSLAHQILEERSGDLLSREM